MVVEPADHEPELVVVVPTVAAQGDVQGIPELADEVRVPNPVALPAVEEGQLLALEVAHEDELQAEVLHAAEHRQEADPDHVHLVDGHDGLVGDPPAVGPTPVFQRPALRHEAGGGVGVGAADEVHRLHRLPGLDELGEELRLPGARLAGDEGPLVGGGEDRELPHDGLVFPDEGAVPEELGDAPGDVESQARLS